MTDTRAPRSDRVSVRVTEAGRQAIRDKAALFGYSEADITRMALAHGLTHMPDPQPKAGLRL